MFFCISYIAIYSKTIIRLKGSCYVSLELEYDNQDNRTIKPGLVTTGNTKLKLKLQQQNLFPFIIVPVEKSLSVLTMCMDEYMNMFILINNTCCSCNPFQVVK